MIERDEPDATYVYIEERLSNHLYAHRDVRLAFRLSGIRGVKKFTNRRPNPEIDKGAEKK
jgi:hypothetical protein